MQQPEGVRFPGNASVRARLLHELGIFGAASDRLFDRFASMAADAVDAPIAWVNLIDDRRQMVCGLNTSSSLGQRPHPATYGHVGQYREMPLDQGHCLDVVGRASPLALNDVYDDPRHANDPLVDGYGYQAYLGVPLTDGSQDGSQTVLGTLAVVDFQPRTWDEEQRAALETLSRSLAWEIWSRQQRIAARTGSYEIFDASSHPVVITRTERLHISYANPAFSSEFGEPSRATSGEQVLRDMGILEQVRGVHAAAGSGSHSAVQMTTRRGGREFVFVARCLPGERSAEVIAVGVEAGRHDEEYPILHAVLSQAAELLY
ncbi:GAF domain-containing protein (plasmid) [Streptomyces sp. NBC_00445]|uniref:GAF domain-containing protein n=1 Tax=Streptomyces sp. NBC_00445 TaxID=2975745 RepID=UPI002E21044D